jgi:hypothetical protein
MKTDQRDYGTLNIPGHSREYIRYGRYYREDGPAGCKKGVWPGVLSVTMNAYSIERRKPQFYIDLYRLLRARKK